MSDIGSEGTPQINPDSKKEVSNLKKLRIIGMLAVAALPGILFAKTVSDIDPIVGEIFRNGERLTSINIAKYENDEPVLEVTTRTSGNLDLSRTIGFFKDGQVVKLEGSSVAPDNLPAPQLPTTPTIK